MLRLAILLWVLVYTNHTLADSNVESSNKIHIDIISDVVCPWCAIGYKRLATAITELNITDNAEITWHPFQLNPAMVEEGMNANKYLMNKMRLSQTGLLKTREYVTKTAKTSGLDFNYFDEMRKPNTLKAHILLDYAKEKGKQTDLKTRLQAAYFTEKKNIGIEDILSTEMIAVGLDAEEGIARLRDSRYIQKVLQEEAYWKSKGVHSIPTIFFEDKGSLRGARSVDKYKEVLRYLAKHKGILTDDITHEELTDHLN